MKTRRYKTGLVVGKFFPFHKGHEFLIESALAQADEVWVMVCQTARYDVPAPIRAGWIREVFPQVRVTIINHPARLDSDSDKVSAEWAELTVRHLGFVPEAVFSSEKYGDGYAACMGSKHVMVDLMRKKFPVSGTILRADIFRNWRFLSQPAKGYYARRVVVLGAESSGTTTLAKDLAGHYRTCWVPEYGRFYYEGRMNLDEKNSWTSDEFIHIAQQQKRTEDYLARKSSGVLICDTDAWVTRVWHKRYTGRWLPELDKPAEEDRKPLYILTDIDIPFEQDGTRDGEHLRKWMHELFLNELKRTERKFIVVSGDKEARLSKAVKVVDRMISGL